jgi:hypothetical protein
VKRALAIALLATQPTCAAHPALTVAIGGGSIGLLSCELQGGEQKTCGIITGAVALGLGGLAWLVTQFADTNAHELPNDDETLPDGTVRVHTHTALPPVPAPASIDAGIVDAGIADSGIADAAVPIDAPVD